MTNLLLRPRKHKTWLSCLRLFLGGLLFMYHKIIIYKQIIDINFPMQ